MTQAGVTINHFFLRGDASRRQELLHSLDQQTWPGEDDEKILIIQRLSVKGEWWEIGSNAAALARELFTQAVHGSSATARNADVVFFNHAADQLACFCVAVLERDTTAWFWKSLLPSGANTLDQSASIFSGERVATANHLTQLLLDYPLDIISIFIRVNQQQKITPLWNFLGADNIRKIFYRMAQASGWSGVSSIHAVEASGSTLISTEQEHTLSLWKNSVLQVAENSLQQEVIRLLALLTAWQKTPYKLSNPNFCASWLAITQSYFSHSETNQENRSPHTSYRTIEQEHTPEKSLLTAQGGETVTSSNTRAKQTLNSENTPEKPLENSINFARDIHITQPEDCLNYLTQTGGIFYLINALRMAGCIDSIALSGLSPWQWVWLIAKKMGCLMDAETQRFFSEQLNLSVIELNSLQYPNKFEFIEQQLQHRFGHRGFWNSSLFLIPARIEIRDPYINVYFHIKNVNVDVRIAGLDIDPGWQPWLGQVIRFHYGYYPELARLNSDSGVQHKNNYQPGSRS